MRSMHWSAQDGMHVMRCMRWGACDEVVCDEVHAVRYMWWSACAEVTIMCSTRDIHYHVFCMWLLCILPVPTMCSACDCCVFNMCCTGDCHVFYMYLSCVLYVTIMHYSCNYVFSMWLPCVLPVIIICSATRIIMYSTCDCYVFYLWPSYVLLHGSSGVLHAIVICFLQVEHEVGEIAMVIVQNKIDLIDDAVVQPWVPLPHLFTVVVVHLSWWIW